MILSSSSGLSTEHLLHLLQGLFLPPQVEGQSLGHSQWQQEGGKQTSLEEKGSSFDPGCCHKGCLYPPVSLLNNPLIITAHFCPIPIPVKHKTGSWGIYYQFNVTQGLWHWPAQLSASNHQAWPQKHQAIALLAFSSNSSIKAMCGHLKGISAPAVTSSLSPVAPFQGQSSCKRDSKQGTGGAWWSAWPKGRGALTAQEVSAMCKPGMERMALEHLPPSRGGLERGMR